MTSSAQSYRAPTVLSRERNRMHARKTRQRKKEHMMHLQARADQLKDEVSLHFAFEILHTY